MVGINMLNIVYYGLYITISNLIIKSIRDAFFYYFKLDNIALIFYIVIIIIYIGVNRLG